MLNEETLRVTIKHTLCNALDARKAVEGAQLSHSVSFKNQKIEKVELKDRPSLLSMIDKSSEKSKSDLQHDLILEENEDCQMITTD
eukprot:CAMPEP_0170475830 /NCGR_PEP_ID=MMETSP0123-20130129/17415_1 /TAXON_ID=182087 /ORGANISM="Favella ehrenbergii, Strain Fehren 1" /LENGTH=85 /DNA_ID=CAMNT_0010746601 /DNA_START=393 /DNA_END=650 /DNA_ORIENTATION=-